MTTRDGPLGEQPEYAGSVPQTVCGGDLKFG
jgi:hypothetical protein